MTSENGISGTNDNKNSKPRTVQPNLVVLTYSVLPDLKDTLIALNKGGASVHYIIEEDGRQTQFADDATQQTFCCGNSKFKDQPSLNSVSINVMLINDANSAFRSEQIKKLISFLQDLAQRHPHLDLKKDIVGLGEIAVEKNKSYPHYQAPGKHFPWETLALNGFGLFMVTTPEQKAEVKVSPASSESEVLSLQKELKEYGYAIENTGVYDEATKAWVTRFNERYVPDATKQLDASIWSKASQLSLEHIQNHIHSKTPAATLSSSADSQGGALA